MRGRTAWLWVLRVLLAAVFAYAAVPKLIDPGEFAAAIQNYRAVPDYLVGYLALFVPVFELVIALGLLLPGYQRGAALLATALLVAFGVAMAQARWRGIDLSCGCFGAALEAKVSWVTVARTLGLGALSAVLLLAAGREPRASEPLSS
jgi:putative oxidoreductase